MRNFFTLVCLFAALGTAMAQNCNFTSTDPSGCPNPTYSVTFFADPSLAGTYDQITWQTGVSTLTGTFGALDTLTEVYFSPGNFNVCVTYTNTTTGQTCNFCQPNFVEVYQRPSATFTATPVVGCRPFSVTYSANTVPGSAPVTNWFWVVPGTQTGVVSSNVPTATALYNQNLGSPFNVSLQVTDANGCQSNFTTQPGLVTVRQPVVANFTAPQTVFCTNPANVQFTNTSTVDPALANQVQYTWIWGDNTPNTTQANPSHTYQNCGQYDPQLIVRVPNVAGCADTVQQNDYITVHRLNAAFNANNTGVCISNPNVSFTNTSTSCIGSYNCSWNFGFGTSTQCSPSVTFPAAGTFPVTLTISNAAGCSDSETFNSINVFDAPEASFTPTNSIICTQTLPRLVNFTNTTTANTPLNQVSFQWQFTGGAPATSTAQNPNINYNNCGSYDVRLIAFYPNAPTCRDTFQCDNCITIDRVDANFTAPTQACQFGSVPFSNTTLACVPGTTYSWDFGGQGTSTDQNPQFAFPATGSYQTTLTATSPNGCTDSQVGNAITVNAAPNLTFTSSSQGSCNTPLNVTFTNTSPQPVTNVNWNFNVGGLPPATGTGNAPTHTYTQDGVYTVSMTATGANGCPNTLTIPNMVTLGIPFFNMTASPTSGCSPLQVTFTDNTQLFPGDVATSRVIRYGNGQTANFTGFSNQFTYNVPGVYGVQYIVQTQFGCLDTLRLADSIEVGVRPTASFTYSPQQICLNDSAQIIVTTDPNTYDSLIMCVECPGGIYLGQDTVLHQYTEDTICYPIRVIVGNNGCFDTLQVDSAVCVSPPKADFYTVVDCSNLSVSFVDSSGSATSWLWDFGVDTLLTDVSTDRDPTYSFPAPGAYEVRLIVSNGVCIDSITKTVGVGVAEAIFTITDDQGCANFNAPTANVPTGLSSYVWGCSECAIILGQGTSNGRFRYTLGGVYVDTFTLVVENALSGCRDSFALIDTISVFDVISDFVTDSIFCGDYSVDFTSTSTAPLGSITEWRWSFPPAAGFVFGPNTTRIFPAPGLYNVALRVRDQVNGCVETKTKQIRISDPRANFVVLDTTICSGSTIAFDNTSLTSTNYIWSTNPGVLSDPTAFEPTALFTTPGVIPTTITLIARDTLANCADTATLLTNIAVSQVNAAFTPSDTTDCTPAAITYTDNTTTVLGTLTNWQWNLGAGFVFNDNVSISRTVTYGQSGIIPVSLIATNSFGCQDTATFTFTATSPAASFTASGNIVCLGAPLTLTNTSPGTGLNYSWDFGDGSPLFVTNSLAPFDHVYTLPGSYTVRLAVADPFGCSDTATASIIVPAVNAVIGVANNTGSCPPLCASFSDATVSTFPIVNWFWDFGNGFSVDPTFTNCYLFPGIYNVALTVTDVNGCQGIVSRDSVVNIAGPIGSISFTPDTGCLPTPVTFTIVSSNSVTLDLVTRNGTYSLTMPANDTLLFTHTYNLAGEFEPYVLLADAAGCQVAYTSGDTVRTTSLVTAGLFADLTFSCALDTVTYTASIQSSETPNLQWAFNNGGTVLNVQNTPVNNSVAAVVDYNVPGDDYGASLIVSNSYCSDTLTSPLVQIVGEPVASFTFAAPNLCETHRVQFTNGSIVPLGPLTLLEWNFGDGSTSNQADPLHIYPIQANGVQGYLVTLVVGNQYGCTDTLTDSVFVYPALNPSVAGDTTVCAGGSAPLLASGGFLYNWSPAAGLSCTTCPDPIASPAATTTYTVQISDGNQCVYNLQVTVGVSGFPTAAFAASYPDPCQSHEIQFTNQSNTPNGSISIVEWTFGDGGTSVQNSPLYAYASITDTILCFPVNLYVENNFGCADSTSDTVCVYPVLNPQVFGDTTICLGGSAPLSALGGYIYDWTPAAGLSCTDCTDPIANPVASTTYNVAFSNGNGCVINLPITVGVSGIPTADFAPVYTDPCLSHIIQFSNISTTPTGSLVDIQWSFGDPAGGTSTLTNPSYTYPVELVQNQVYNVTLIVANEFTCADTVTESVTVYPILTPQISADTLICFGDSAQLSTSGGPIITWSPPTGLSCTQCNSPMASPPVTTIYAALYNNGNGCLETRNVTVSVSNVQPAITPDQASICYGGTQPITVTSLDGTTFDWTPIGTLSCVSCPDPIATPDSTTTYTVIVTDGGNCVDSASITVVVNFPPELTMLGDTSLCAGQPTLITAIPVGNGPFVFEWDPNNAGLTSYFIPTPIATPSISTVYTVTVTDANLCESYGSVTVNVLPIPAYTLTPPSDSICPGDTVQFSIVPGNVAVSYQWTPSYALDNDTIPNPIAVPLESTAFIVTMTFPNTCTIRDTSLIWMIDLSDLGAGPDLTVCFGDSLQLQGSSFGNADFSWSPGALISGDSTLQLPFTIDSLPYSPVTFYAEIDRRGCIVLDSMEVTVIEKVELTVSPDTALCLGDSVQIYALGADTYVWSPIDGLSDPNLGNPIASPQGSTQYQVIGSTGACESDTAVVTLTVRVPPTIEIEADRTTFFPGDIVNLNAIPQYAGYGYTWSPASYLSCGACPNPGAFPDQTTTFYLTVTDDLGCASTDSVTLRLRDRCVEEFIVVPNGFSPNGDGVNDVLYVRGIPNIETFAVYNRWGEQLFQTNNILDGWDGTLNGKPVEPGVYVWFVVAPCPIDGSTFKKTGNVTVVK